MTSIRLPYLTSSVETVARSGKLAFGYVSTDVEVQEVRPEDFRLASCHVYSNASQSIYAFEDRFWSSAMYCARPLMFNAAGIAAEAPFSVDGQYDRAWHRRLSECLVWNMRARAKSYGATFPMDDQDGVKVGTTLSPGDGLDEDKTMFVEWCAENLRFADGRLIVRVHEPSIVLSWSTGNEILGGGCLPFQRVHIPLNFGQYKFDRGLHFSPDDPSCQPTWEALRNSFEYGMAMSEGHTNVKAIAATVDAMEAAGCAARMVVRDMMVYDPEVFESIDPACREDMAVTSAASVFESSISTIPVHLLPLGPKRDLLEKARTLVNVAPADRPSNFADIVERALASVPRRGQPARAWFVSEALQRLADRRATPVPISP